MRNIITTTDAEQEYTSPEKQTQQSRSNTREQQPGHVHAFPSIACSQTTHSCMVVTDGETVSDHVFRTCLCHFDMWFRDAVVVQRQLPLPHVGYDHCCLLFITIPIAAVLVPRSSVRVALQSLEVLSNGCSTKFQFGATTLQFRMLRAHQQPVVLLLSSVKVFFKACEPNMIPMSFTHAVPPDVLQRSRPGAQSESTCVSAL